MEEAYKLATPTNDKTGRKYPYIPISNLMILTIERNLKGLSPNHLAQIYLIKEFPYIHEKKDIYYYQAILLETHSIIIEPISRSKDEWAYSKFTIKKILSQEQCGLDLHTHRYLQDYAYYPKTYSYQDYIAAWDNSLLYENKPINGVCRHIPWLQIAAFDNL